MYKINKKISFLVGILTLLLLGGCTADEESEALQEGVIPIRFEIEGGGAYTRAPGDAGLSVNRILILPFKKTDESATNDASNFVPEYSAAKQINVNSFPAYATMLNLSATSTYQIMVIGYNQNDYDFANQSSPSRRFNIGSSATPATMANMYLQPVSAVDVPEFFTCVGTGYMGATSVGTYFKPGQVNNIKGTLARLVSGMTLTVNNIPNYVNSINLVAEQLVTATRALDATPLAWQTAGDSGVKSFGSKVPVAGTVTFNMYLLATPDAQKTLFYLDVSYGIFTERYTMKVPDTPGVSSGNRLIFTRNHWVRVTGSYAQINLGFTITDSINLDDDKWDGLQ